MSKFGEEELYYYNKFSSFVSRAAIAGGAIRDYLQGKDYNDVDIFVPENDEFVDKYGFSYVIDELLWEIFDIGNSDSLKNLPSDLSSSSQNSPGVYCVYEVIKNNKKYQFIFIRCSVTEHIKKYFDLNSSKVYYHNGTVHKSAEYKQFEKTKKLELILQNNNFSLTRNTLIRAYKILLKYPEVTFGDSLIEFEKYLEQTKKDQENTEKLLESIKPLKFPEYDPEDAPGGYLKSEIGAKVPLANSNTNTQVKSAQKIYEEYLNLISKQTKSI